MGNYIDNNTNKDISVSKLFIDSPLVFNSNIDILNNS